MKRALAIILALVLCVGVFATVGFAAEEEKYVELTIDNLGVASQSYAAGTPIVGGVNFEFQQIGNYGDGIQMRDKNGNTSILWNTSAFAGNISKIELTYSDSKDVTHSNADCVIFSFGSAADSLTYTTKLSTTAGEKNYTITPEGNYTFFKMEHDLSFTMYWKSIKIYYKEAAQAPVETPVAGKVTVHAKVPAAWEGSNLWAWGSEGDAFENWPGEAMTLNNGWYEIEMPNWVTGMVLNYNGDANKTGDIAVEAGKEVWVTVNDDLTTTVSYTNPNPAPSTPAEKPDDNKENSKTGDATALVAISAAMLLAATGVVAVVSNKKHF